MQRNNDRENTSDNTKIVQSFCGTLDKANPTVEEVFETVQVMLIFYGAKTKVKITSQGFLEVSLEEPKSKTVITTMSEAVGDVTYFLKYIEKIQGVNL